MASPCPRPTVAPDLPRPPFRRGPEGGGLELSDISGRGLVLLGCGKMGTALLEGWLARGLPPGRGHRPGADPVPAAERARRRGAAAQRRAAGRAGGGGAGGQAADDGRGAAAADGAGGRRDALPLDRRGHADRGPRGGAGRGLARSCAPCRTRRRRSGAGSRRSSATPGAGEAGAGAGRGADAGGGRDGAARTARPTWTR